MKLYMVALLTLSFLDNFSGGTVRGSLDSQMMPRSQCISLHTKVIRINNISSYEEQESPVKAVIFINRDGVRICVPHNLRWVKKAINGLKQRSKSEASRRRLTSGHKATSATTRLGAATR
ncbi:lymphotactin-like [Paroedura picta]|uniref:lymphotactin-like n=1 Tax=Paroedura picta TaxID=143630 RepID=UPI00405622C4